MNILPALIDYGRISEDNYIGFFIKAGEYLQKALLISHQFSTPNQTSMMCDSILEKSKKIHQQARYFPTTNCLHLIQFSFAFD
jgi:hypothetical protein